MNLAPPARRAVAPGASLDAAADVDRGVGPDAAVGERLGAAVGVVLRVAVGANPEMRAGAALRAPPGANPDGRLGAHRSVPLHVDRNANRRAAQVAVQVEILGAPPGAHAYRAEAAADFAEDSSSRRGP